MFSFESLELLYWDYWERVNIPLDERIIAVVGPNGSGKTTLLDALRTLLGIKPSQKRDYKKYARRANKPHSWIVATVKNEKDRSGKHCFYPIFTEKVTLACHIEKKGGEWQRNYFVRQGIVPIEELNATSSQDILGLREYQSVLERAGLTGAMLRVLSLEQGSTDKLCEYSPRELLSLVYDAFGDKATLDNYEKARQDQLEAERELEHLNFKVAKLENHLTALVNKVNNHLEYVRITNKRIYLQTEIRAQAQYVSLTDDIDGKRRNVTGLKKEIQSKEKENSTLAGKVSALESEEARIGQEKAKIEEFLKQTHQNLVSLNGKRSEIEAQITGIQELKERAEGVKLEDVDVLRTKRDDEIKKKVHIEDEIAGLQKDISEYEKNISKLKTGTARPTDGAAEAFSAQLKSSGITHSFIYEGIEIINEKWRLAIEAILRGYKYVITIEDPARKWQAWSLGEAAGYRHFIVADAGQANMKAPAGSALEVVELKRFVPDWIRKQLAEIYLVDSVNDGKKLPEGATFVTSKGFCREKRGGRSIAVSERDFIFGVAGRKRQIEFAQEQISSGKKRITECKRELSVLETNLQGLDKKIEKQGILSAYLMKKGDEEKLREELETVLKSIESTELEKDALYANRHISEQSYQVARDGLVLSREKLENLRNEFRSRAEECRNQRSELLDIIRELRKMRINIPFEWRSAEKIALFREKFGNIKNVDREIEDIENKLNEGNWEKDHCIVELKVKVERDHTSELANVRKKEYEFAETKRVTDEARAEYINILRHTIRFYEKNLKVLAELAGVELEAIKPRLENDDAVLKEAGLEIKWNFDGKGFISTDDGEASGGQQVIKSLILLIALMMNEGTKGGFVFIDEPFAHLDVFNIDKVAEFLLRTETQFIITSPNTHNTNIYRPAMLSIMTKKKRPSEQLEFAPPPAHIRR